MSQKELNRVIGDFMRQSRESRGITQAELAKIAKVQQSLISRIETNTSRISFCAALKILEIINKTAYDNITKVLCSDLKNVSDNKYLDKYKPVFMHKIDIDLIKENHIIADNLHNNGKAPSVGSGDKKASIYPCRPAPAQQEIGLWLAAKRNGESAWNFIGVLAAA